MKIGKHKKGQGSLWGFLAVNYIAFTLLLLTVASLGVLGASLYTRAKAPFPDAEEFLRKAAAGGDEDFARLRVERYLGNGAGAFLFDQTGYSWQPPVRREMYRIGRSWTAFRIMIRTHGF